MAREQRLVFGEVAELYDKARPTYPRQLVEHVTGLVDPEARVLDIGCGTGKATVLLAERLRSGIGLEPDRDMAAMAWANLAPFPAWSVVEGDFEEYHPATGEQFDLLTSAQAWHWLDPARRFQQAARLLRPGGYLALFWNRTAEYTSAVRRDVDAVYKELFSALSPHGMLTAGRPPVGTPPPDAGFDEPKWRVFSRVERYRTSEWTDLVQTHSDHRMLDPRDRTLLLERIRAVIDAHGGIYDHAYDCWLWTARRL